MQSTVNLSTPLVKTFSYSAVGNLLTKSDVGNYNYPAPGSPQPHAVTSLSGGTISTTFTYDSNGNQTSGLGRSITYSSYNKPSSITQGTQTISFLDDTEHQRFQQVTPSGTTLYIAGFGVLAELSGAGTTAAQWTDYLAVGNAKVGMRVLQTASETLNTRYFHTDHLGSISVITDENGNVLERLSYDAWGKRRFPNGTDDPSGSITSQTTRGFTGEEELSVSGLVHLNGRVYDPLLARFTSADTVTQFPYSTQGWNRYSYVNNDPLAFTDPSGHCVLGCFWQHVGHFISGIGHAVSHFLQTNPVARAIVQIGITIGLNVALPGLGFVAAGLAAGITTGLAGGNLGQALKAGFVAGATSFAFSGLGPSPSLADIEADPLGFGAFVGGSALVGCGSAVASGGKCGAGAAAAATSAGLAPFTGTLFPNASGDIGQKIGATIFQATAGGLASVAGGGKFANGAITGSFQYLATTTSLESAQQSQLDPNVRNAFAAQLSTLPDGRVIVEGADSSYIIETTIGLIYAPFRVAASVLQGAGTLIDPLQGVLNNSSLIKDTPQLTQYGRPGNFDTAVSDFNSLGATNIRPITNNSTQAGGFIGDLSNGDTAIVRPTSSGGQPTLEIQRGLGPDIKIRYQ